MQGLALSPPGSAVDVKTTRAPRSALKGPSPSPPSRVSLNRHHAQLVVEDKELDARFAKDCYVRRDLVTWKWRDG